MKLPHCWDCQYHFKLREIILPWKQKCPVCGKKQFLTKESRFNTSLFGFIPMTIIFMLNLFVKLSTLNMIIIGLFIILLFLIIAPYFYKFTENEEPIV